MNTSLKTLWKSASSVDDTPLAPVTLGYFHQQSRGEAHELVLSLFMELSESEGVTRARLARRLGKSPEQITRWLSAPGNWTLDTVTDLLLAMGHKPTFGSERLSDIRQSNRHHPVIGAAITVVQTLAEMRSVTDFSGIEFISTPSTSERAFRVAV